MSAAENKEAVRRIYEALAQSDRSVFTATVHQDYVWRIAGQSSWSRAFHGREEINRKLLAPLFALFATRYTASALNLIAEGDHVVAEVRGDVETRLGQRYDNEYCFVFRFRNGKIAELTEYCDTDLIEKVLGSYEAATAEAGG